MLPPVGLPAAGRAIGQLVKPKSSARNWGTSSVAPSIAHYRLGARSEDTSHAGAAGWCNLWDRPDDPRQNYQLESECPAQNPNHCVNAIADSLRTHGCFSTAQFLTVT